ncbi:MAG: Sb-PDE family phosphodiesterase [Bacteroidales bacterium]
MKNLILTCACLSLLAQTKAAAQTEVRPRAIKVAKEYVTTRNEIKLPQIDGYLPLKCDFHIHTMFSDGNVWPTVRVQEAWEDGLDVIAITDHLEYRPHKSDHNLSHNRSYELAVDEAKKKNIILIKGTEVTRGMPPGHFNLLFIKDADKFDQADFMTVMNEAKAQDAFVLWNHPGWGTDSIRWHEVHETLFQKGIMHGIEVFNELEWYPEAFDWVLQKNLTLIGNSDVHGVTNKLYEINDKRFRPMTIVLAKDRSEESVREAMFAGRTFVCFFDQVIGKEDLLRKLFQNSVEVKQSHYKTKETSYVEVTNNSDIPYKLRLVSKVKGYPSTIDLPRGKTVLVSVPANNQSSDSCVYEVINLLISPEKQLQVKLF